MSASSSKLEAGIILWQNGRKEDARQVFEAVIHEGCREESAWIWYSYSRQTDQEKINALNRSLILFPRNENLRKALAELREQERRAVRNPQEQPGEEKKEAAAPIKLVPVSVQEAPPQEKTKPRRLPWILVTLGIVLLLFSSITFFTQYNALQSRYQKLEYNHQMVSQNLAQRNREYTVLEEEKTSLSNQFASLQDDYDSLNGKLSTLQGEYTTLKDKFATLSSQYDSLTVENGRLTDRLNMLQVDYNNTLDENTYFRENAITPPYIYIYGREAYLAFLTPEQGIYKWRLPFAQLEEDLRRGNLDRNLILLDPFHPILTLNNKATGETYRVIDYRKFVDPSEFTTFSQYFYQPGTDDQAFIYELWYIVAQLTAYSEEIKDTPRYPLETLLAGGGDCEDHAILYASMLLAAAPQDWKVYLVYMDADHPTAPETINHLVVAVDTGNGKQVVEATGKYSMDPYEGGVVGWFFEIER